MGKVGGPTPTGIHAYHSSPHDFTRFENRLLTGEGANVYGAGTYLAENPKVSGQGGQYWKAFSDKFPLDEASAAAAMFDTGFDRTKAIEHARKLLSEAKPDTPIALQRLNALRLLESGKPVGPRTYEVNFKAKPEELLDWDKRLIDQPHIEDKIADLAAERRLRMGNSLTGEGAYGSLMASYVPSMSRPAAKEAASIDLRSIGIPGIRYLDEGSRGTPYNVRAGLTLDNKLTVVGPNDTFVPFADEAAAKVFADAKNAAHPRTHNYVAFDPSKLDIMAKYGVVGGVPLGAGAMGSTAAQDQYR